MSSQHYAWRFSPVQQAERSVPLQSPLAETQHRQAGTSLQRESPQRLRPRATVTGKCRPNQAPRMRDPPKLALGTGGEADSMAAVSLLWEYAAGCDRPRYFTPTTTVDTGVPRVCCSTLAPHPSPQACRAHLGLSLPKKTVVWQLVCMHVRQQMAMHVHNMDLQSPGTSICIKTCLPCLS